LTDSLFARYAGGGRLFLRPDAVDKTFTGALADKASLNRMLSEAAFDPTALVLVARPKEISYEWRLLVANGEVIAGSQYRAAGEFVNVAGCPGEVHAFTATVLQQVDWRPDALFVMDVCESENHLRLVELNSFSCSGHYLADLGTVVRRASELASLFW
jgi:hypothetical protein